MRWASLGDRSLARHNRQLGELVQTQVKKLTDTRQRRLPGNALLDNRLFERALFRP